MKKAICLVSLIIISALIIVSVATSKAEANNTSNPKIISNVLKCAIQVK